MDGRLKMTAKSLLKPLKGGSWIRNLVLIVCGIVFLIPLFWMISTSLKPDEQIMAIPAVWIPRPLQWKNYLLAVRAFPFVRYFLNTTFISVVKVAGTLLTAAMGGYAFAKLSWPGRDKIFVITIATMFIPAQVLLVPMYILFAKLGWINTYLPLIVPAFCGGSAFGVFLMRQFIVSVPDELLESARMDGASEAVIFSRIIIPLCTPVFVTLGMFTFIFSWNDFIGPLLYILDKSKWVLPLGLRAFQQQNSTQWNLLMAASTLTSLPLIILYFWQQEKIARGYSIQGGIK